MKTHSEELTHRTKDANGQIPDLSLKGLRLQHSGNGKVYRIVNFAWDGETDLWSFIARDESKPDSVFIVRPLSHITGRRDNGKKRYTNLGYK